MTMYFFLYNLYLLDCGFKENFLGLMMSTMNIGSIACTIPAGVLIQRLGIRKSLLLCIVMVSAISATRALFLPRSAVLALALGRVFDNNLGRRHLPSHCAPDQ